MNRIIIIGATGSGKTTLAFRLAAKLDIPAVDLDELYWRPGWKEAPEEEFLRDVDRATSGSKWVISGNYAGQKDITWPRADTLIWLDYSLARTFSQLARRTYDRIVNKPEICNGNRESFGKLFSRDSIILWLFQTHGKKRRKYGEIFNQPEKYPQIKNFVRLKNPAELEKFFENLKPHS